MSKESSLNTSPEHDHQQDKQTATAEVKHVRSISKIWLIPLIALSIGLWMLYYQWSSQGPLITIELKTASGLEAGKTKIKSRDVDIGLVEEIQLKDDLSGVIVTARMAAEAAHLLREDSQVWIVSPRVSLSGISGLNTLLSGTYIALSPGSKGGSSYNFVALDRPPVTPAGTPGLHITLNSDDEFAFSEGDPIVYKGLEVGKFEDIYFNLEERIVYYNAFIKAPYHQLITTNTKFWNISGLKLKLEASGVAVETGSLETLLTNGVTFGVPEGIEPGEKITERAYFDIYPSHEKAAAQRYRSHVDFVIMIDDTVRGLKAGAPVEYRGLVIGEVKQINLASQSSTLTLSEDYKIPVLISVQPGRIRISDDEAGKQLVKVQLEQWINQGLRASLKTGNMLTGALFVDLQHYQDAPPHTPEVFNTHTVIPTISGEFSLLTQRANNLLVTMTEAADSITETSDNLDHLILSIEEEELTKNLNTTLGTVSQLLQDYSAGSVTYEEINDTMKTLQLTLKELQPLLLQLNNTPNSLIFSGKPGPEPEPKKGK